MSEEAIKEKEKTDTSSTEDHLHDDEVKIALEQTENEEPVKLSAKEELSEFAKTALWALLLAFVIRTFFLEPFNIPSGSMKPTLLVGDYLFVSKPAYGFSRYSFPFGFMPIEGRIWGEDKMPVRGDVIVFKLPTNPSIDYIKRIVGMPGDIVQMVNGELYINRVRVKRTSKGMKEIEENGRTRQIIEYEQTLPNGVQFTIYEDGDYRPLDNTKEYKVPDGHYFVMGDNRDNSQDSRVEDLVGFVPYENIVGKAAFIFFSTNGNAKLFEFWKWPGSVRGDRIGQGISPAPPNVVSTQSTSSSSDDMILSDE